MSELNNYISLLLLRVVRTCEMITMIIFLAIMRSFSVVPYNNMHIESIQVISHNQYWLWGIDSGHEFSKVGKVTNFLSISSEFVSVWVQIDGLVQEKQTPLLTH